MKQILLSMVMVLSLSIVVMAQPVSQQVDPSKVAITWKVVPNEQAITQVVKDVNGKLLATKAYTKTDLETAKGQLDAKYQSDSETIMSAIKMIDDANKVVVTKK